MDRHDNQGIIAWIVGKKKAEVLHRISACSYILNYFQFSCSALFVAGHMLSVNWPTKISVLILASQAQYVQCLHSVLYSSNKCLHVCSSTLLTMSTCMFLYSFIECLHVCCSNLLMHVYMCFSTLLTYIYCIFF